MTSSHFLKKKVLITGGTGSLGKNLVNRLKIYGACPIVYSRDEGKQVKLEMSKSKSKSKS